MRRAKPELMVMIETELWPSWIAACVRQDVPVVIASGRLRDLSGIRFSGFRRVMRSTFKRVTAVGARTDLDAERFVALGVPEDRVRVTGDLKLDPPIEQPALAIDLRRTLADVSVPVVVGGSTYRDEEIILMRCQDALERAGHSLVLVLAPRKVERAHELLKICGEHHRRAILRSQLDGRPLAPGDVLILDTLGELAGVYATATIAFVGGSLVPIGGHNIAEPIHAGCPVLFGPHVESAGPVPGILAVGRAGICVEDARGLREALAEAFEDLEACRRRGELGRNSLAAHRGSYRRTHELIQGILETRGGSQSRRPAIPYAGFCASPKVESLGVTGES
jgi:3-deoxy-D-manno-octulosonic-acid transferase